MHSEPKFSFDRGAHVCHLFEGGNERKAVVVRFLLEGLRRGEACLHVTDRQSLDEWHLELQTSRIDVHRAREEKALALIMGAEFRRAGEFTTTLKAREVQKWIEERIIDFPGVRIAFDVAWEQNPPIPADRVCHWEAAANLVFEDQDVRAICQYDLAAGSPAVIHSALRTHPQVILAEQLYLNPFYEARRILDNEPHLNHSDADAPGVEAMINQIRSSRHLILK